MKTKDKKGITLIEVMIAIAITTTVLSIGYNVLNKVNTSPKEQAIVSDVQNGMNNIRSLISKEIKYCEGIEIQYIDKNITVIESEDKNNSKLIALNKIKEDIISKMISEDELSYQYNILKDVNENSRSIKSSYKINITTRNNKKYFSIDKIDSNGVVLNLISSQAIVENILPMDISKEDDLYNISINYKNNKDKKYSFKVYSEFAPILYADNSTEENSPGNNGNNSVVGEVKPPSINQISPPSNFTNSNMLGFWVADSSKCDTNNLYTWISSGGKLLGKHYSTYPKSNSIESTQNSEIFNISASARPGNNKQTNTSISMKTSKAYINNVKIGDKNISKISIYVAPYTILKNINISTEQGNSIITLPNSINSIYGESEGKWVNCIITKKGNSKVNFSFNADISFDMSKTSSGYALILYE